MARCLLSGDGGEEVRIFYSYARKDAGFRRAIDDVLGRFKWDVRVRAWYDAEIPAGSKWETDIFRHIDAADIILLFVTRAFLESAYCCDIELPRALARQARGEALVIPVLVEAEHAELPASVRTLQCLPRNGVPIARWNDESLALRDVVQGIVDRIAGAILDPESRCRWQLRLRSSTETPDDQIQLRIVEELRERARDPTLRPLALGSGSVIVLVESTREGYSSFRRWRAAEVRPTIAELDVLEVFELFGAGIQASVADATDDAADRHDFDLLLLPSAPFTPPLAKGVVIPDASPLQPDFVVDSGDIRLEREALVAETSRAIDYFLTAVAVPESEHWVNLSPDETNRMLGKSLAGTEMGRRLLEFDLELKRFAASLLHPDCETGEAFWWAVFGARGVDAASYRSGLATFQRVWIVPQKAVVFAPEEEGRSTALVVEQRCRILCEQDYVSRYVDHAGSNRDTHDVCTQAFREIVLPVIEKEVNECKTFAGFRQMNSCMILASWLKKHIDDHPAWRRFVDTGKPRQLIHSIHRMGPADLTRLLGDSGTGREGSIADATTSVSESSGPKTAQSEEPTRAPAPHAPGRGARSAEELRELANDLRREFGLTAHLTQETLTELGTTLRAKGRSGEARSLHTEVLSIRRYVLGDDHPYTLVSMSVLAETLEAVGDSRAASELRAELAERRSRTSEAFSIRENREFYERYMRVFRQGVFRLTRTDYRYGPTQSTRTARVYFSGAIDLRHGDVTTLRG